MKKNVLIIAVCAIFAFGLSSCTPEKTNKELLTAKGWVMDKVECNPPYLLLDGSLVSSLLGSGFFEKYEEDDILIFGEDQSVKVDPGKLLPETGVYQTVTSIGLWAFTDSPDDTEITYQVPWCYKYDANDVAIGADDDPETAKIVTLDKDNLTLRTVMTFDNELAKTAIRYTFTIYYKHK